MLKHFFIAVGLTLAAPVPAAPGADGSAAEHPEAKPYEKNAKASQDVDGSPDGLKSRALPKC